MLALKEAQPVVPQTVTIVNQKLPDMKEGEEIETFLGMLEAALRASKVPETQWCAKLHAHLNPSTKLKIQDTIQNPEATYNEIKDALLGCSSLTFSAAAETLLSADRGRLLKLPYRQFIEKMTRLIEKVAKEAADEREIYSYIAIAHARSYLNPALKTYTDLKGDFSKEQNCRTVEEWVATQPMGVTWHNKQDSPSTIDAKTSTRTVFAKKPGSYYHCGKPGHFSRECRSRLAAEKGQQQPTPYSHPMVKTEVVEPVTNTRVIKKEITCFNCRQKGHKSPQCPLRQTQVKKIKIPSDKVVQLKHNELFGAVGNHRLPITCDSGADLSVVPEECVSPEQLLGETCEIGSFNNNKCVGNLCKVDIHIHGKVFHRRAVTQPGETLNWTAFLNLPFKSREEWLFIADEINHKADLTEEQTLYLPPELKDSALLSGVLVSEGTLVDPEEEPVVVSNELPVAVNSVVEKNIVEQNSISVEGEVNEEVDKLRENEQNLGDPGWMLRYW